MQSWFSGLGQWFHGAGVYLDEHAWAAVLAIVVGSIAGAWVVEVIVIGLLARIARRTKTTIDDQVLALVKQPIYLSVLLIGINAALGTVGRALYTLSPAEAKNLELAQHVAANRELFLHMRAAVLETIAIIVWTIAIVRVGGVVLRYLSARERPGSIFQPRSHPVFDIVLKTLVLGSAGYLALVAWEIDVRAWLASAGIVGIAVGFAARDSLANYFAGLFIIADAPYKIGDVIVLDEGTRGRVTDIGLRSTRILTRADIEINIPNSVLGNMKVVNASAGPSPIARVSIDMSVAYGSDPEQVAKVLCACVEGTSHVADREAEAYFVKMEDSGLRFELHAWVNDPGLFEVVRHELNIRAYRALRDAGIEIPYPKTDVYVRAMPAA